MIKPTVGRIVWLYGAPGANHDIKQPFAASVAFVWSDRLINVSCVDHDGWQKPLRSVMLLQDDDPKPDGQPFAVWMPYQAAQAKKHEAEDSQK